MLSDQHVERTPAIVARRITGVDVARALAMFAMVLVHYVWPDGSDTWIDRVAAQLQGRAMPLFVMLGGLGVSFLAARSAHPDRALLIRAAILFPMGVALQEATVFLAIILQYYAVFFLAAIGLRRLPNELLLAVAAVIALIGTWSYQVATFELSRWTEPGQLLTEPDAVVWSLLFNGRYPFFPIASFFALGMAIGRTNLRSSTNAARLAIGGSIIGFGALVAASVARATFGVETDTFGRSAPFSWGRLLDTEGHSEMLAWVISAAGTSTAVLGACLWLAPRVEALVGPLVALGQLSLTFYVAQALIIRVTADPREIGQPRELFTALVIYVVFMAFAFTWRQWFRFGPLEVLFRVGSWPRPAGTPLSG